MSSIKVPASYTEPFELRDEEDHKKLDQSAEIPGILIYSMIGNATKLPDSSSTAIEVQTCLDELGFRNDFKLKNRTLHNSDLTVNYQSSDLSLLASYRFEGASNPDDNSIIYVLRATDGTGIYLADAFGAKANPKLGEFMREVPDNRDSSALMEDLPPAKTIAITVKQGATGKVPPLETGKPSKT